MPTLARRLADVLTTPHGPDRFLEQVRPHWSLDTVRARVVTTRRQTADTVTVVLRPNRNWLGARAGQHVQLTVEVDGVRHTRCFSVASSAHDADLVELTCKAGPDSVVSRHLRDHAGPGTVVELSQAAGDFTLPTARPDEIVLMSGGSGITPVLSMLRTLCDEDHAGRVTFVHYARSDADVLYGAEVQALADANPNVRTAVITDLFDESHLAGLGIDPTTAETWLCGPAPFMDAVQAVWTARGAGERVHVEHFGPATSPAIDADADGTITFAASGTSVANDGRTLLEQAEAAGLSPASGCRMGICHTCVRPKTAGCVRDAVTGELDADEGSIVRICVSVPVGDVSIDL
jgi:ferredoxin-NADP reductase